MTVLFLPSQSLYLLLFLFIENSWDGGYYPPTWKEEPVLYEITQKSYWPNTPGQHGKRKVVSLKIGQSVFIQEGRGEQTQRGL